MIVTFWCTELMTCVMNSMKYGKLWQSIVDREVRMLWQSANAANVVSSFRLFYLTVLVMHIIFLLENKYQITIYVFHFAHVLPTISCNNSFSLPQYSFAIIPETWDNTNQHVHIKKTLLSTLDIQTYPTYLLTM